MQQNSPARMLLKKRYILGDFNKYATGRLATHFAAISDMALYEFSEKLYLDEKNNARRCHMLLVGHYSRKSGGPPVWAHATGERICYYSGSGTQVTPLVQDIHSSKVYYDPPFSYIGGSQDYGSLKPGMNPERKLERAVVDSAINFIFLLSGRLEQVSDLMNPDILSHFRLACTNLVRHRKPCVGDASYKQGSDTAVFGAPASGQLHSHEPIAPAESNLSLARLSMDTASPSPGKRQFVDLSDDLTDGLPTTSNKRTRLFEHISNFETEMNAKHESEIRELRAQLEQQQAKTGDAKEKLMREKTKRRQAQVERETWREKYLKQQALAESATKSVKQEEGSEDWKAMLFEQERKTEHYKLKYIALKEEKKAWQAQTIVSTEGTTEREVQDTIVANDHPQEDQVEQPSAHCEEHRAPTSIGFVRRTNTINSRELSRNLAKYWQCSGISAQGHFGGRIMSEHQRRSAIMGRLGSVTDTLLLQEQIRGVDVEREDVKRRAYIQAVEQTRYLMETQGLKPRAKKSRNVIEQGTI